MIVLRQKAFNRAEKEAIRQIWRKTNGLKQLPNGITSVEDAKALKHLSAQLNKGEAVEFTPEIRTALNNMGLTKITPELMTRLNQKYSNIASRMRFNQIYRKDNIPLDDIDWKEAAPLSENSWTVGGRVAQRHVTENNKIIDDSILWGDYPSHEGNKFTRFYRKKLGGTVIETKDPNDGYSVSSKRGGSILRILPEDAARTPLNIKRMNTYIKRGNSDLIGVGRYSPPEKVLHEINHNRSGAEFPRVPINTRLMKKYRKALDRFDTIAEENMASAYTLNDLRNQPNLPYARKVLNNNINTYVVSSKHHLLEPKYKEGIPLNSKFTY